MLRKVSYFPLPFLCNQALAARATRNGMTRAFGLLQSPATKSPSKRSPVCDGQTTGMLEAYYSASDSPESRGVPARSRHSEIAADRCRIVRREDAYRYHCLTASRRYPFSPPNSRLGRPPGTMLPPARDVRPVGPFVQPELSDHTNKIYNRRPFLRLRR